MALLELKTNLKSLKYGSDRPSNGSSGLPFVQFALPEVATSAENLYYLNNRYNVDFPVRGGGANAIEPTGPLFIPGPTPGSATLTSAVNTRISLESARTTQANLFDKVRIGGFLKSTPRGTLFVLKQQALQFANPKIQVAADSTQTFTENYLKFAGDIETTRIYNPGNTLAQVAVQGSGDHLNRHGSDPYDNSKTSQKVYSYVANERNFLETPPELRSRLISLLASKIYYGSSAGQVTFGISRNSSQILNYQGGPTPEGEVATGMTIISKAGDIAFTDTFDRFKEQPKTQADYFKITTAGITTAYDPKIKNNEGSYAYVAAATQSRLVDLTQILQTPGATTLYSYENGPTPLAGTNRTVINRYVDTDKDTNAVTQIVGDTIGTTNATNFNYAFNYQMLSQENSSKKVPTIRPDFRLKVRATIPTATNQITSTEGYEGTNNIAIKYGIGDPGSPTVPRVDYTAASSDIAKDKVNAQDVAPVSTAQKDFITFRVDTIEENPRSIIMRAFLNNINDNHSAEYKPFRYIGRGENFYVYDGFSRTIGFAFTIAAQTRDEMKPLYRKLNYLVSQLYPDYAKGTGFMRTPLMQLTLGDYISKQPGFFTSMNIVIPENAPWDINFEESNTMYQLPQVLEVTCNYTLIHNFLPKRSTPTAITPLITPSEANNRFQIGV